MEIHVAAIDNVTCWAFRKLCVGATDSYTGVISMGTLVARNNAWKEVDTFEIPGQRQWIQVATSKEKECSDFIKRLDSHLKENPSKDNVYGVQINASCPSPNLIRVGQGPALIKRASKVSSLLHELLKQDNFKVGIKVRLGLNAAEVEQRKIIHLFDQLEAIGDPNLSRVTVHFKHAGQRSAEPYDYSILKELVSYKLPLVLNGGIRSAADVRSIIKDVDNPNIAGVMAARAALEDSNCFARLSNELNWTTLKERTMAELKTEFMKSCQEHEPKPLHIETIKRFCRWAR